MFSTYELIRRVDEFTLQSTNERVNGTHYGMIRQFHWGGKARALHDIGHTLGQ